MDKEPITERASTERLDLATAAARVTALCTEAGERTYELGRAMVQLDAAWQAFRRAARTADDES